MNAIVYPLFGIMISTAALAEDTPVPVDWRLEQPGWGMGLQYGPRGPSAVLRGWSNAALSMDIEGGINQSTQTAQGGGVDERSTRLDGWIGVAPRVRIIGTKNTDLNFVPSLSVQYSEAAGATGDSQTTSINFAAGVAVDRWFAPGVSFTGRLDAAQVGLGNQKRSDDTYSFRSTAFNLVPSVAVHVYPTGLRKRARP